MKQDEVSEKLDYSCPAQRSSYHLQEMARRLDYVRLDDSEVSEYDVSCVTRALKQGPTECDLDHSGK